jgi:hypothetical protein
VAAGARERLSTAAINIRRETPGISIPNRSLPRFAPSSFIRIMHERESREQFFRECETEARAQGFRALELMATLPGIEFYKSAVLRRLEITIWN